MNWTEYLGSLQESFILTKEYNVTVSSEELIGTTEYLKSYTRYRINRCRYNRGRLYVQRRLTPYSKEVIFDVFCEFSFLLFGSVNSITNFPFPKKLYNLYKVYPQSKYFRV